MRALLLISVVIGIEFCGPAFADLSSPEQALRTGFTAAAFKELRALADLGNSTAQADLGDMYFYGHGLPKDYAGAWRFTRL